ncbi:hypothetical protein NDU88_010816 [Pleurodeles waltl]|uniref:Uncharacterized protein n=1 Tax=Pleurodeles waltl TaxID=8319 RepID=A0AAV7PVY5_PLEWA|nr:hypothetical protein NDU88_010816 [Pleurodeles waltl]
MHREMVAPSPPQRGASPWPHRVPSCSSDLGGEEQQGGKKKKKGGRHLTRYLTPRPAGLRMSPPSLPPGGMGRGGIQKEDQPQERGHSSREYQRRLLCSVSNSPGPWPRYLPAAAASVDESPSHGHAPLPVAPAVPVSRRSQGRPTHRVRLTGLLLRPPSWWRVVSGPRPLLARSRPGFPSVGGGGGMGEKEGGRPAPPPPEPPQRIRSRSSGSLTFSPQWSCPSAGTRVADHPGLAVSQHRTREPVVTANMLR